MKANRGSSRYAHVPEPRFGRRQRFISAIAKLGGTRISFDPDGPRVRVLFQLGDTRYAIPLHFPDHGYTGNARGRFKDDDTRWTALARFFSVAVNAAALGTIDPAEFLLPYLLLPDGSTVGEHFTTHRTPADLVAIASKQS